jgi:GNAT superfamily N-acetyltransferase
MRCDQRKIAITVSDVNIKFSASMSTWDDFDDCSTRIEGTIVCVDKKGNEKIVGRVRLFHLDIGATYDTNDNLHDLFDIRPETAPFYSALIDHETGDFKSDLERILGEYICDLNVLIVDRLEILPEFRGKKVGRACLLWCLRQYAHECGVLALKCFPLQFECAGISEPAWRRKMQNRKAQ